MTEIERRGIVSSLGWTPEWVMPNVTLDEPIEASYAALVNSGDERLHSIARRRPAVETFLSAFRDEFQTQIWPTDSDDSRRRSTGCQDRRGLRGFRDAVCASAIVAGRVWA